MGYFCSPSSISCQPASRDSCGLPQREYGAGEQKSKLQFEMALTDTTGVNMKKQWLLMLGLVAAIAGVPNAHAQKKYSPGANDTEIKLGQTMPYSGPASAYG